MPGATKDLSTQDIIPSNSRFLSKSCFQFVYIFKKIDTVVVPYTMQALRSLFFKQHALAPGRTGNQLPAGNSPLISRQELVATEPISRQVSSMQTIVGTVPRSKMNIPSQPLQHDTALPHARVVGVGPRSFVPSKHIIEDLPTEELKTVMTVPPTFMLKEQAKLAQNQVFLDLHPRITHRLAQNGFEVNLQLHECNSASKQAMHDSTLINVRTFELTEYSPADYNSCPVYLLNQVAALTEVCNTTIAYELVFNAYITIKKHFHLVHQEESEAMTLMSMATQRHARSGYAMYVQTIYFSTDRLMTTTKYGRLCKWMHNLFQLCIQCEMELPARELQSLKLKFMELQARVAYADTQTD